jgi:hypothetical protein
MRWPVANGRRPNMTNDLPDSVRRLVEAVSGFLHNDDGDDDKYIMAMQECVDQIQCDGGEHRVEK